MGGRRAALAAPALAAALLAAALAAAGGQEKGPHGSAQLLARARAEGRPLVALLDAPRQEVPAAREGAAGPDAAARSPPAGPAAGGADALDAAGGAAGSAQGAARAASGGGLRHMLVQDHHARHLLGEYPELPRPSLQGSFSVFAGEIRDFSYDINGDQALLPPAAAAFDAGTTLPSGSLASNAPPRKRLFLMDALGTAASAQDLTPQGVLPDDSFNEFDLTPLALSAINYIAQEWFCYVPDPSGGHLNPDGLKRVSLKSGAQLSMPQVLLTPVAMQYDVLSKSLLLVGAPPPNALGDAEPLRLEAYSNNEGPVGSFYEYPPSLSQALYGVSCYDAFHQTFYAMFGGDGAVQQLVGVRRPSNVTGELDTFGQTKFEYRAPYAAHYAWPERLAAPTLLEFGPEPPEIVQEFPEQNDRTLADGDPAARRIYALAPHKVGCSGRAGVREPCCSRPCNSTWADEDIAELNPLQAVDLATESGQELVARIRSDHMYQCHCTMAVVELSVPDVEGAGFPAVGDNPNKFAASEEQPWQLQARILSNLNETDLMAEGLKQSIVAWVSGLSASQLQPGFSSSWPAELYFVDAGNTDSSNGGLPPPSPVGEVDEGAGDARDPADTVKHLVAFGVEGQSVVDYEVSTGSRPVTWQGPVPALEHGAYELLDSSPLLVDNKGDPKTQSPSLRFPVFMKHSGADTPAIVRSLSQLYKVATDASKSFLEADPKFGGVTAGTGTLRVTAGESTVEQPLAYFDVQAINVFGVKQAPLLPGERPDNFTVRIISDDDGFPSDSVGNPARRPAGKIDLGFVISGDPPASGSEVIGDPNNGGFRFLRGPNYVAGSRGRYRCFFGLERAGNYTVIAMSRGSNSPPINLKTEGSAVLYSYADEDEWKKLTGTPYRLTVMPGATEAAYSSMGGDGTQSAIVGETAFFTLYARDAFGNRARSGGADVEINLRGVDYVRCIYPPQLGVELPDSSTDPLLVNKTDGSSTGGMVAYCEIEDRGDGSYDVAYYVTRRSLSLATYSLTGLIFGQPIGQEYTVDALQGKTDAGASFATPEVAGALEQVIAGEQAYFTISATDRFSNNAITGGDAFRVTVTDTYGRFATSAVNPTEDITNIFDMGMEGFDEATWPDATLVDNGDGTYTASFRIFVAGGASVAVELLDDEYGAINAIEGSPFFLRMIPSRTFPGQCQVFSSFNATASAPLEIVVQARDEYGNNRTELEPLYSDSPLDAVIPESILSPTMRVLRLFNAPAGAYAATEYIVAELPAAVRPLELSTRIEGGRLFLSTSSIHAGAWSLGMAMFYESQERSLIGSPFSLQISKLPFSLASSELLYADTSGSPPTLYSSHQGDVLSMSASQSGNVLSVQPLVELRATAGLASSFSLQRRDIYGNLRRDRGERPSVRIVGEINEALVSVDVNVTYPLDGLLEDKEGETAHSAGIWLITFLAQQTGSYKCLVESGGEQLLRLDEDTQELLPFTLLVQAGVTVATLSYATGPGVRGGVAGVELTFDIVCQDRFGNPRPPDETGGFVETEISNIEVILERSSDGERVQVAVAFSGTGAVYTATYIAPTDVDEEYSLDIFYKGVRIGTELDDAIDGARFPVTPKFKLGPGAPNEARSVFDPLLTRISVGSEGNALRVQARDEDDQDLTGVGLFGYFVAVVEVDGRSYVIQQTPGEFCGNVVNVASPLCAPNALDVEFSSGISSNTLGIYNVPLPAITTGAGYAYSQGRVKPGAIYRVDAVASGYSYAPRLIGGGNFSFEVRPGVMNTTMSEVVSGIKSMYDANETARLELQARDRFGNEVFWSPVDSERLRRSWSTIVERVEPPFPYLSKLTGPGGVRVIDRADGSYEIAWTLTSMGVYEAATELLVDGVSMGDYLPWAPSSPAKARLMFEVRPGPLSVRDCIVGDFPTLAVGKVGELQVVESDAFGNLRVESTPGLSFEMGIETPRGQLPVSVSEDRGGATHALAFIAGGDGIFIAGTFEAALSGTLFGGDRIELEPAPPREAFVITVLPAEIDVARCEVSGPGIYSDNLKGGGTVKAGERAEVYVTTKDRYGNQLLNQDEVFELKFRSEKGRPFAAIMPDRCADPEREVPAEYEKELQDGSIVDIRCPRPGDGDYRDSYTSPGVYTLIYAGTIRGDYVGGVVLSGSSGPDGEPLAVPEANYIASNGIILLDGSGMGVRIKLLPGAVHAPSTVAFGSGDAVPAFASPPEMAAGGEFSARVLAADEYGSIKNDVDDDRFLEARLRFLGQCDFDRASAESCSADLYSSSTATSPDEEAGWSFDAISGFFTAYLPLVVAGDDEGFLPARALALPRAGLYSFEVYVVVREVGGAPRACEIDRRSVGILAPEGCLCHRGNLHAPGSAYIGGPELPPCALVGTGAFASPYNFTVLPDVSDPQSSKIELPAVDPAEAFEVLFGRRRRELLEVEDGISEERQELEPHFVAFSGLRQMTEILLRDAQGNVQRPDERRPLDRLEVYLGETLLKDEDLVASTYPDGYGGPFGYFLCPLPEYEAATAPSAFNGTCAGEFDPECACVSEPELLGCSKSTCVRNPYAPDYGDFGEGGVALRTINIFDAGSFVIEYEADSQLPAREGFYRMDVLLGGVPLLGSPFALRVYPGPTYGPSCTCYGAGMRDDARIAEDMPFVVEARDFHHNLRNTRGDAALFTVSMRTITGSDANGFPIVAVGCYPHAACSAEGGFLIELASTARDGVYAGSYRTDAAGMYDVAIDYRGLGVRFLDADGVFLTHSPKRFRVLPGAIDPLRSVARGYGVTAGVVGVSSTFVVEARDSFGNRLIASVGADAFRVLIYAPGSGNQMPSSDIMVTDRKDGTYPVTYTPRAVGTHTVLVLSGQVLIEGGRSYQVFIGDQEHALVPTAASLIEYQPGGYWTDKSGVGHVLAGVSKRVVVQAKLCVSGDAVVCSTDQIAPATGGGHQMLAFVTHSLYGAQSNTTLLVDDLGNGTSAITLNLVEAGHYRVHVRMAAAGLSLFQKISGAPFSVVVKPGPTDASATQALELNPAVLATLAWTAGEPAVLTIQARDAFGNLQKKTPADGYIDEFDVAIAGESDGREMRQVPTEPGEEAALGGRELPNGQWQYCTLDFCIVENTFTLELYDAQSGLHRLVLMTTTAQPLRVSIKLAHAGRALKVAEDVMNTPASPIVRSASIELANSVISGLVADELFSVEQSHILEVIARDRFGNHLTSGGHGMDVRMLLLEDIGEGGLGRSANIAAFDGRAAALGAYASTRPGEVADGGIFTFLKVRGTDVGRTIKSSLHIDDRGDGTYRVRFACERAGRAIISVTELYVDESISFEIAVCSTPDARAVCEANGVRVITNGLEVSFRAGLADSRETVITSSSSSLERAIVGKRETMRIIPRDAYRNRISDTVVAFTLAMINIDTGLRTKGMANYYPVDVFTDEGAVAIAEGSYIASYLTFEAGRYVLEIERSGKPILCEYSDGRRAMAPCGPVIVTAGPASGTTSAMAGHAMGEPIDSTSRFTSLDRPVLVARAGEVVNFDILSFDQYANPRVEGGEVIAVSIGRRFEGVTVDNSDGTYTATYNVTVAGDYELRCQISSEPIRLPAGQFISDNAAGGFFALVVEPGAVHYPRCELLNLEGVRSARAGFFASIDVQAYDQFGNPHRTGGQAEALRATITRDDIAGLELAPLDRRNGVYSFKYKLFRAGYYVVAIFGETRAPASHIRGSPFTRVNEVGFNEWRGLRVNPSGLSVLETTASGKGLASVQTASCVVGKAQSFLVQPRDEYGNALTPPTPQEEEDFMLQFKFSLFTVTGGVRTEYSIAGADVEPVTRQSDGDASELEEYLVLRVAYTPYASGLSAVSIEHRGTHIAGSPYLVPVSAGAPTASNSYLEGFGLYDAIVGVRSAFYVYLRDELDNPVTRGGWDVTCFIVEGSGRRVTNQDVFDLGNGAYRVLYLPSFAQIRLGEEKITRAIYPDVSPGECERDPSRCAIRGLAVRSDVDQVAGNASGLHSFVFSGTSVLSPPPGVAGGPEVVVGVMASMRISLRDEQNRLLFRGGDVPRVDLFFVGQAPRLSNNSDPVVLASIEDQDPDAPLSTTAGTLVTYLDPGHYNATFVVEQAGFYSMEVYLDARDGAARQPLAGSPFVVRAYPGPSSAQQSQLDLDVLNSTTFAAGEQGEIVLHAADDFGNAQRKKTFQLVPDAYRLEFAAKDELVTAFALARMQQSVRFTNNDDGTMTAVFISSVAASYSVGMLIGGEHVQLSPSSVEVVAGDISATFSYCYGTSAGGEEVPLTTFLEGARALDESGAPFVMQGVDRFGNLLRRGGDIQRVVTELTRNAEAQVAETTQVVQGVTDNFDGTYAFALFFERTGTYRLFVFIDEELVTNGDVGLKSTAMAVVSDVSASASQTIASGPGILRAVAGEVAAFTVALRDVAGNAKLRGEDQVRVRIDARGDAINAYGQPKRSLFSAGYDDASVSTVDGESGAVSVVDNGDGTYLVTYVVSAFGEYAIAVQLRSDALGSQGQIWENIGAATESSPFNMTAALQPAPVQLSAQFSDTATRVSVRFNRATNRGGLKGLDDCEKVLLRETTVLLGRDAICTFPSESQLDIYLGYGATLEANGVDGLLFRPRTDGKEGILSSERNSEAVSGKQVVSRPDLPPSPSAIVRGPTRIGVCDDFFLDSSGSFGTAGRPLNFTYSMLPNVRNESVIAGHLAALVNNKRVTIERNSLALDEVYTFTVTVTNFLGQQETVRHELQRLNLPLPSVVIQGQSLVSTTRGESIYLRADVALSSCFASIPEMDFSWDVVGSPAFALDEITRYTKTLYVPANSLEPGATYILRVTGTVAAEPELYNSAIVFVKVGLAPLRLLLEMPEVIAAGGALTIDASRSIDPDDPNPDAPIRPFGPWNFRWECVRAEDDPVAPGGACFDDIYGELSPSSALKVLRLSPGTLAPGKYRFYITVQKEPLYESSPGRLVTLVRDLTVRPPPALVIDERTIGTFEYDLYAKLAFGDALRNATLRADEFAALAAITAGIAGVSDNLVAVGEHPLSVSARPAHPAYDVSRRRSLLEELVDGQTRSTVRLQITLGDKGGSRALMSLSKANATITAALLNGQLAPEWARAAPHFASDDIRFNGASSTILSTGSVAPTIKILALDAPIDPRTTYPVINSNERAVFQARVLRPGCEVNVTNHTLRYEWSVQSGQLDLNTYPRDLGSRRNSSNLVIKPNVLQPGRVYTLGLLVTNLGCGLEAVATTTFAVNAAPSSGIFDISPLVGSAIDTAFALSAEGWEDDNSAFPVVYEFRYIDPISREEIPLVPASKSNEAFVHLPPVSSAQDGYQVVLLAYVIDAFGAKSVVSKTVTLEPPEFLPAELGRSATVAIVFTRDGADPRSFQDAATALFERIHDFEGGLAALIGLAATQVRVVSTEADRDSLSLMVELGPWYDLSLADLEGANVTLAASAADGLLGRAAAAASSGQVNPPEALRSLFKGAYPMAFDVHIRAEDLELIGGCADPEFVGRGVSYVERLVRGRLRIAVATNNVDSVLTLAKAVKLLGNQVGENAKERRALIDKQTMGLGEAFYTPDHWAEIAVLEVVEECLHNQTSLVTAVLKRVIDTTIISGEQLDQLGDTYRELVASADALRGGGPGALDALDGVRAMASASAGDPTKPGPATGISPVSGQALLDALGGLVDTFDPTATSDTLGRVISLTSPAHRHLASVDLFEATPEEMAAQASIQSATDQIVTGGLLGAVDGEDALSISSRNLQVSAKRRKDISGEIAPVAPDGVAQADMPAFDLPASARDNALGDRDTEEGEEIELDVVSQVNRRNPHRTTNTTGDGPVSRVAGNVASLELKAAGGNGTLAVQGLRESIKVTIPVNVTGNSCRRTAGGCRYWDEVAGAWSTAGMVELMRYPDRVVCLTTHLSEFAISSDDIVPEFHLVNPVDAGELFTNLSLDNMLAIIIVGMLLVGFVVLNYIGYRADRSELRKSRLMAKISSVDSRWAVDSSTGGIGAHMKGLRPPKPLSVVEQRPGISIMSKIGAELLKEHQLSKCLSVEKGSLYTRPQRLTVLLCIIMGNITVTAIFFAADTSNMAQKLFIGVVTALLLLPGKEAFELAFRSATYIPRPVQKKSVHVAATRELRKEEIHRRREQVLRMKAQEKLRAAEAAKQREMSLRVSAKMDAASLTGIGPMDVTPALPAPASAGRRPSRPHRRLRHTARTLPRDDLSPQAFPVPPTMVSQAYPLDGAPIPPSMPTPPPPPGGLLPQAPPGGAARPRRRMRGTMAGMSSDSFAPPPPPIAAPQAGVPQPPPPALGRPTRPSRARRMLARAQAIGALGGVSLARRAQLQQGDGSAVSAPPPPPQPPGGGTGKTPPGRPRRRRAARAAAAAAARPPTTGVEMAPITGPGSSAAAPFALQSSRPGAGRAAAAQGDSWKQELAWQRQQAITRAVMAMSVAYAPHLAPDREADGALALLPTVLDGVGGEGIDAAVPSRGPSAYVPEPILRQVLIIQRRWRRKKLLDRRRETLAIVRLQAAWRGARARRLIQEERLAKSMGQPVQGLWWVTAHLYSEKEALAHFDRENNDKERLKSLRKLKSTKLGRLASGKGLGSSTSVLGAISTSAASKKHFVSEAQSFIASAVDSETREQRRERKKRQSRRIRRAKKPSGLPRWFVYVAYFFAFVFVSFCSLMIMLYGLTFEPAVGRGWLLASAFSLFIELMISDPGKIVVLVYFKETRAKAARIEVLENKKERAVANLMARRNANTF